jgi:DNA-binding LacI/PurR family transcriptional regulator
VRTNDAKGIRQAVGYLVGLGHRDIIHHVDGGVDPGSADWRRAYRAAMRGHGLSAHAKVIPGAHTEEASATAARAMLEASALPTAVLVGYDDSHLSDNPRIDVTTVHQDAGARTPRDAAGGGHARRRTAR